MLTHQYGTWSTASLTPSITGTLYTVHFLQLFKLFLLMCWTYNYMSAFSLKEQHLLSKRMSLPLRWISEFNGQMLWSFLVLVFYSYGLHVGKKLNSNTVPIDSLTCCLIMSAVHAPKIAFSLLKPFIFHLDKCSPIVTSASKGGPQDTWESSLCFGFPVTGYSF